MTHQLTLTFRAPEPVAADDVQTLLRWLDYNAGFHTAKQIGAALDYPDRKIRQLAEAADGLIVSGPGSPGYCHLNHCSPEMLTHLTSTLISQGKNMIRRALKTRQRAHHLIA